MVQLLKKPTLKPTLFNQYAHSEERSDEESQAVKLAGVSVRSRQLTVFSTGEKLSRQQRRGAIFCVLYTTLCKKNCKKK